MTDYTANQAGHTVDLDLEFWVWASPGSDEEPRRYLNIGGTAVAIS